MQARSAAPTVTQIPAAPLWHSLARPLPRPPLLAIPPRPGPTSPRRPPPSLAPPYPLSSSSSSRDCVLSELQCRHHMTAAAGAARAGARRPRPSRAPATVPEAAGPQGRSPTTRPAAPRPAGPSGPAPAGSLSPRPASTIAGPVRPSRRRRPPSVAQVRPEECGREGAGQQGGGGALVGARSAP